MKNFITKISILVVGLLLVGSVAHGASCLSYFNGGTGTCASINGLVKSNGYVFSTVVSGTDIKTVNNSSLLGSGNISVGTFTLPSLTSGSVLFSNGTTIAQDNANFFWDATNHRRGIGTTSPGQKLEVNGGIVQDAYTASGTDAYGLA